MCGGEDAAWPPRGMRVRAFGWEQKEKLGEWAGWRGRGRRGRRGTGGGWGSLFWKVLGGVAGA